MGRSRRFKPPIYAASLGAGLTMWKINIDDDERQVVVRMLGELREMLLDEDDPSPLLARLFPPAFTDDEEKEAEYQRLMREELVTSRVTQLDVVIDILGDPEFDEIGKNQVIAMMQSINAVRVVLGTMLDVGEDDVDESADATPEHHLYGYLSWLLDWTVKSLAE